jgi:hypothetical protein
MLFAGMNFSGFPVMYSAVFSTEKPYFSKNRYAPVKSSNINIRPAKKDIRKTAFI